jgi:hypothetical protein
MTRSATTESPCRCSPSLPVQAVSLALPVMLHESPLFRLSSPAQAPRSKPNDREQHGFLLGRRAQDRGRELPARLRRAPLRIGDEGCRLPAGRGSRPRLDSLCPHLQKCSLAFLGFAQYVQFMLGKMRTNRVLDQLAKPLRVNRVKLDTLIMAEAPARESVCFVGRVGRLQATICSRFTASRSK